MKITAIICEFNPLHTGHKYLIDYAKTFSDKVICIMSGNFTQRGLPACCDKFSRAKHAILAGADLVVELPTVFATASAENFAFGGVTIAKQLKADCLLFGSECGDINKLQETARLLLDKKVNEQIAIEVKRGVSYPRAVSNAVKSDILDKPNNVLAIEYLKTLTSEKSSIVPITLKREDNFNGVPQKFASSGALRANRDIREKYTFGYVINDIDDDVEQKYKMFATSALALKNACDLLTIEGVSEGIENRIFAADKSVGYDKMMEYVKTKRYTQLRLQRIFLNAVLNITKEEMTKAKSSDINIKALAVKTSSAALLANVCDETDEITKKADRLYYSLSKSKPPLKLLKID